ncbi:hypothetical protein [Xanthomonas sp. 3498]|uniref:hypothetical protein n=1 Tax=Xanthomonas sp. 3498 TaxID=2663863 RepID=UPI00161598DB|nr:hypothetical protein [Xanthomonas sp. 3498]MBB5874742.1 hypothetical protein [Xanthomonas sp. 3498]
MPSIRVLALTLALSVATAPAAAAEPVRYLELSNRAYDALTSLAVAAPGSEQFREVALHAPLRGGGDAATFPLAGHACRYDLRFTFRNGRSMLYRDVDICAHRVRIRPLPHSQSGGRAPQVVETAGTSP